MKPNDPRDTFEQHDFDQRARMLHRHALAGVSPKVLARLREARHAATAPTPGHSALMRRPLGWLLAGGGVAAAMALMLALQLQPTAPEPATSPRLANVVQQPTDPAERASDHAALDSEIEGMLAALDENPDLYLWLAANDDTLPPPSDP